MSPIHRVFLQLNMTAGITALRNSLPSASPILRDLRAAAVFLPARALCREKRRCSLRHRRVFARCALYFAPAHQKDRAARRRAALRRRPCRICRAGTHDPGMIFPKKAEGRAERVLSPSFFQLRNSSGSQGTPSFVTPKCKCAGMANSAMDVQPTAPMTSPAETCCPSLTAGTD